MSGYDEGVWRKMAGELGLHGIAVPEEWGGAGAGMSELAVVFEEMGARSTVRAVLLHRRMATQALLTSGDRAAMEDFLPTFVDGTTTATLILNGQLDAWDAAAVTLTAARDGDGYRVNGRCAAWCSTATLSTSCCRRPTPLPASSLFAVAADVRRSRARATREPRPHSQGRPHSVRRRTRAGSSAPTATRRRDWPAHRTSRSWRWPPNRSAQRSAASTWPSATPRSASSSAGPSEASRRSSTGARTCSCSSKARARPSSTPRRSPTADELAIAASVAKMACSEAFLHVALDNMRIHGGIGFTWEHDAHLYVRRAKATELIFGSPDYHAQRLADLVSHLKGPP